MTGERFDSSDAYRPPAPVNSPQQPEYRADQMGMSEPDDRLNPVVRGCLVVLGVKLGCLLMIVLFFLFAMFMTQFATFKEPK